MDAKCPRCYGVGQIVIRRNFAPGLARRLAAGETLTRIITGEA